MQALRDAGFEVVLAGMARASGKPGVCFTITGPGLTNILTPMGQAWSDSSSIFASLASSGLIDCRINRVPLEEVGGPLRGELVGFGASDLPFESASALVFEASAAFASS